MGWCGGTAVFDGALDLFLKYVPKDERQAVVKLWLKEVRDGDWDCLDESNYFDDFIKPVLLEEDPDWYNSVYSEDEDEEDPDEILRAYRRQPEPFTDY